MKLPLPAQFHRIKHNYMYNFTVFSKRKITLLDNNRWAAAPKSATEQPTQRKKTPRKKIKKSFFVFAGKMPADNGGSSGTLCRFRFFL